MKKFNFSPGGGAGNKNRSSARVRRRAGVQSLRGLRGVDRRADRTKIGMAE